MTDQQVTPSSHKHNVLVAALGWIFPVGLIWYLVDKDNLKKDSLAKNHVKQGFLLAIFWLLLRVVIGFVPILALAYLPVGLVLFIFFIIGLVNAFQEKQYSLPLIGKFDSYLTFLD